MTRKLEETLDLPRLDEVMRVVDERAARHEEESRKAPTTADEFRTALERSMAMDEDILTPRQLAEHDKELDGIAEKSMETFLDLRELGFNVEAKHSGPIFEQMVNVLRLSMDARNTKIEKKLRMIKMQLDRERLELQKRSVEKSDDFLDAKDDELFADRNKILDLLPDSHPTK